MGHEHGERPRNPRCCLVVRPIRPLRSPLPDPCRIPTSDRLAGVRGLLRRLSEPQVVRVHWAVVRGLDGFWLEAGGPPRRPAGDPEAMGTGGEGGANPANWPFVPGGATGSTAGFRAGRSRSWTMTTGRSAGSRYAARVTIQRAPSKACDQLSPRGKDRTGSYSKKHWLSAS